MASVGGGYRRIKRILTMMYCMRLSGSLRKDVSNNKARRTGVLGIGGHMLSNKDYPAWSKFLDRLLAV